MSSDDNIDYNTIFKNLILRDNTTKTTYINKQQQLHSDNITTAFDSYRRTKEKENKILHNLIFLYDLVGKRLPFMKKIIILQKNNMWSVMKH